MKPAILKYPRTPHLEGSRLQPGDEDLTQISFSAIAGKHLIVEEKIDGANTAISFDGEGHLLLQSRGHYLTGGYRERHYELFKQWANVHQEAFHAVLRSRYILYGEWMYAKHTVYYDKLPHYFLEFDVLDRESGIFLDTSSRRRLLGGLPLVSVPVLAEGCFFDKEQLTGLIGHSGFISEGHLEHLRQTCRKLNLDEERFSRETDPSTEMEGIYMKVEEHGQVTQRLKFVRSGFFQVVQTAEGNWLEKPIVPNGLAIPVEALYEPTLPDEVME